MVGVLACATLLTLIPGTKGNDKIKKHATAPITAIAADGTTWTAGEARFEASGGTLKVTIDLATGVPNAEVGVLTETMPAVLLYTPAEGIIYTDDRGDLKYTKTYGLNALEPFEVWVSIDVKGTAVSFSTDKSNPVTMDPKG